MIELFEYSNCNPRIENRSKKDTMKDLKIFEKDINEIPTSLSIRIFGFIRTVKRIFK